MRLLFCSSASISPWGQIFGWVDHNAFGPRNNWSVYFRWLYLTKISYKANIRGCNGLLWIQGTIRSNFCRHQ